MNDSRPLTRKEITIGDAAVEGLLDGVVAGVVMVVYLVAIGLVTGEELATVLSRFDPGEEASPLTGTLTHLAVAGVYGVLFGLGHHWIGWGGRLPGWSIGLMYGFLLLLIAEAIILPGTDSPLREIAFLHFALAHVIYGLALGFAISRTGIHR